MSPLIAQAEANGHSSTYKGSNFKAYKRFGACVLGVLFLGASTCNAQLIFHKKKKVNKSTSADNNAQPDKILYDKAMDDIKHGRQEVGRLNMQTLINTYPDSEYLAKAKLAIADSYYKEGGTGNLTLAISAYKDFIVFFPFLPEASYAQKQVAMAHYRQMEKPDRDRTQALAAEEEFQTFLLHYPNDPLAPQAQQYLREVQEVLAEGDYRIGYYYYVKGDRRAAATRLLTVASRYPLYSRSDRVLWMMGDIFEKSEHKEVATLYYGRIVKDYPLSPLVPTARDKLKDFGTPIPQADPNALAWMTAEQNAPRPKQRLVMKPLALVNSRPGAELRRTARNGTPNMQPPSDTFSAGDLLTPGGKPTIGGTGPAVVATIVPGTPSAAGTASTDGAQPAEGAAATPATTEAPKEPPADGNANPGASATATEAPKDATGATDSAAKPDAAASGTAQAADGAKTDTQNSGDSKNTKESSSKKKKGLRKIVPW